MQDYRNLGGAGERWRMSVGRWELVEDRSRHVTAGSAPDGVADALEEADLPRDVAPDERCRHGGADTITVTGNARSGYRLKREISLGRDFADWPLGDAGFAFAQRRDAEAYGILLAMQLRGDLPAVRVPEPAAFGGRDEVVEMLAREKRRIFFAGASHADPRCGWDKIDPDGVLGSLPGWQDPYFSIEYFNELPIEDQAAEEETGVSDERYRVQAVIDLTEEGIWHFRSHALTPRLIRPFLNIVRDVDGEAIGGMGVTEAELPYAALLLLSRLRDAALANWFFPVRQEAIRNLIPQLRARLSPAAEAAIERHRLARSATKA